MSNLQRVIHELKKRLNGFEVRKEQMEMMESVYKAMKGGLKTAAHAPTGTGKSLGYLIPAIAVKLDNEAFKLTVSTYTISLQEQLLNDLEMISVIYKKLSGRTLNHVVLKGRNNYLCEHNYQKAVTEDELPPPVVQKLDGRISEIKKEGGHLDRQTLGVKIAPSQWELLTPDSCHGVSCPHHQSCTFYAHHQRLNEADIIVTNHSLFFTRQFFLPDAWEEFHFTIFDEAHKLETVLLSCRTFSLSSNEIRNWVFLAAGIARKFKLDDTEIDSFVQKYLIQNEIVRDFYDYCGKYGALVRDETIAFHKTGQPKEEFNVLLHRLARWQTDMYDHFIKTFVTDSFKERKDFQSFREQFSFWRKTLADFRSFTSMYFHSSEPGVLWSEKSKQGHVSFKITPSTLSSIPNPFVKPLLLTSGTLATAGSCRSFAERIQINLDEEIILPTPFRLDERSLVYLSKDLNPKAEGYQASMEEEIWELIKKGKRKTFVLFTAYKPMRAAFDALKHRIESHSNSLGETVEVWLQEENNGNEILESFRSSERKSVLFGTMRYFEGIDLKGEALTQLILVKLPFSRPDHPIQEILDQNPGYSKWEALIKMEQAYGRLIRTSNDYGTFALLDSRPLRPYFSDFLHTFQKENIPITHEIEDIERFYKQQM